MNTIPLYIRNNAVTDCRTVTEFALNYSKYSSEIDHITLLINRMQNDVINKGFTSIFSSDSLTGEFVTYIGKRDKEC